MPRISPATGAGKAPYRTQVDPNVCSIKNKSLSTCSGSRGSRWTLPACRFKDPCRRPFACCSRQRCRNKRESQFSISHRGPPCGHPRTLPVLFNQLRATSARGLSFDERTIKICKSTNPRIMSALGNRQVQGQARKSQDRPGEPGSQCLLPRIPLILTSPPARRTKSETKQNRGREKGIQNALARIPLG